MNRILLALLLGISIGLAACATKPEGEMTDWEKEHDAPDADMGRE